MSQHSIRTRTSRSRVVGIAAALAVGGIGLSACSSGSSGSESADPMMSDTMSEQPMTGSSAGSAMTAEFGDGCTAVPTQGPGSFEGMSADPVATAASNNPVLSTLVTAVGEADLVSTLNSADGITVFAPTNDAFATVPKDALSDLLADKKALTKVLTYHVVSGQLTPEDLAGTHETLAGESLEVTGSGEQFMVNGTQADIVCGNVKTANATVYIVDGVLMPSAK